MSDHEIPPSVAADTPPSTPAGTPGEHAARHPAEHAGPHRVRSRVGHAAPPPGTPSGPPPGTPPGPADLARYRANLQGEIDGASLYTAMAEAESHPALKEFYRRMAETETRHGWVWRERLEGAGTRTAGWGPSWRTRLLMLVARVVGPAWVVPTIAGREAADRAMYDAQPEAAAGMPADERSHARLFRELARGAGLEGGAIVRIEGRHKASGGNALRAAVLGANDGLVSNLSLAMGVAGASGGSSAVLVAGLAGLLAGALSMAIGEWLSVQSARELYAHQVAVEREELLTVPDEEEEELALIYESKGLAPEQARQTAKTIVGGDLARALDTLAREELGIDPEVLGGSAWVAAATSFMPLRPRRDRPRPAVLRRERVVRSGRLGRDQRGRPDDASASRSPSSRARARSAPACARSSWASSPRRSPSGSAVSSDRPSADPGAAGRDGRPRPRQPAMAWTARASVMKKAAAATTMPMTNAGLRSNRPTSAASARVSDRSAGSTRHSATIR